MKAFDWSRFYAGLDAFTVTLPTFADGEPIDARTLLDLMSKIQANRNAVDRLARGLHQKIAIIKREIGANVLALRCERALLGDDPSVTEGRAAGHRASAREIASRLDYLTHGIATKISLGKSRLAEAEEAMRAIHEVTATLQTSKEVLNAIQRQLQVEMQGR